MDSDDHAPDLQTPPGSPDEPGFEDLVPQSILISMTPVAFYGHSRIKPEAREGFLHEIRAVIAPQVQEIMTTRDRLDAVIAAVSDAHERC